MISLLTTIIPHIRNIVFVIDAKISNMVNVLLLDNPFDALKETPCTPLRLTLTLSYQQCLSSQGVLQVNLCLCESKTNWKVSKNGFPIMILSCWLTLEGSLNVKSSPTRLVLLQCKSTHLIVQQHHEGKLYSILVVYCFSDWWITATFVVL